MKTLILLVMFTLPVFSQENPSEEQIKIAQQICQYKAMIASTTQQTRIDYLEENKTYQAWETFFFYVSTEMNFKQDEGLKNVLEIAKGVFFDYPTEVSTEEVLNAEFDKCWIRFINENEGVAA